MIQNILKSELQNAGITNPLLIKGVLAIVSKESGFVPKSETSYKNTSNERIRKTFSKTKTLSEQDLLELKKSDAKFFNFVYNGVGGNNANEGYKFRGRGLNQLTGKNNYLYYGNKLGLDLIKNPELVNDKTTACKIVALYFKTAFDNNKKLIQTRYGVKNANEVKDPTTAVKIVYNANAGFKKTESMFLNAEGFKRALDYMLNATNEIIETGAKNPLLTGLFFLVLISSILILTIKNK